MASILSIAVLANPDDTDFAGQANPCPTLGLSVDNFVEIAPATASQITAYPSAVTQIKVKYFLGQQIFTGAYITGVALGTVITNSNA